MIHNRLTSLIALALIAPATNALEHGQDGTGQAVLLPYYTVHQGLSTVFAVTNHDDIAKAVRVVIAEGRNGRPGLTFNVYLAARDTWSAALVGDATGTTGAPLLLTSDTTCTSATIPASGVALRNNAYTGARADGLGTGLDRLHRGQIELIELGTLSGAAAQHAQSESCEALRARFDAGGAWAMDVNADVGKPTGRISAEAQIIDVVGGVAFSTEPFALDNFSNVARHGNGSADFNAARIYKPVGSNAQGEFEVHGSRALSAADAVSLLMMTVEVEGAFMLNESMDASTRWILTFPTRPAYLDNLPGGELSGDITGSLFAIAPGSSAAYCVATTWQTLDRRGMLGAGSELPMCQQVNVVEIVDAAVAPAPDGFEFGTGNAQSGSGPEQGRLRVGLRQDQRSLRYTTGPGPSGNTFAFGLPVIALSLMEVRNQAALPGVLASYAIAGRIVRKRDGFVDF